MPEIKVPAVEVGLGRKVVPMRNNIVAYKEDCCAKELLILTNEWSSVNPIAVVLYNAP